MGVKFLRGPNGTYFNPERVDHFSVQPEYDSVVTIKTGRWNVYGHVGETWVWLGAAESEASARAVLELLVDHIYRGEHSG